MACAVVKGIAVTMLAVGVASGPSGCHWSLRHRMASAQIDCADARAAVIETFRELGYAVAGVYDPMPGRLAIIAAEKTTAQARYQANVTIGCDGGRAEVIAVQPTLARHDPHFEEDFRALWEGHTGGVVRASLARSGPLEVTRGSGPGISSFGSAPVVSPAPATRATGIEPLPQAAAVAARPARPAAGASTTARPAPDETVSTSPVSTAATARPAVSSEQSVAPAERVAEASLPPTAALMESPTVRFDLLSAADARERFGADLAAAGIVAARLGIVNRTARAYLVSVPLVTVRRASGETVTPLAWSDASARIAESPAGKGWKTYDEMSRELATDRVLEPGESLSGILLYPAAEYTSVQALVIDQRSARSERFEGTIPPPP